jgi:predicted PurR-regulated permease PerM
VNLHWNAQKAIIILSAAVVGALIVLALYWAKSIFIPIALAIYLTFLLSLPVNLLQRLGLRRSPAVLLVAALAFTVIAGLTWVVVQQVNSLMVELPSYRSNVQEKARALREFTQAGAFAELDRLLQDVQADMESAPTGTNPEERVKVVVQTPAADEWSERLHLLAVTLVEPLAMLLLSMVMVFFMLLKREDLRNRIIRLLGPERLTATTNAIDETDRRIARFLLYQFLVNAFFALAVTIGLALVGVKYAPLWGLIAGLFRYVPYVGSWIGAFFPLALSIIVSPSWEQPLLILGLFLVLDIVVGNVIEPVVFGHSIGVSEVALLVAAAFWTFLWGPLGLVLSGPLTVCLVVASRHIPQLWFFDVLLGDAPPLAPATSFYQRLLAKDQDEAAEIVRTYLAARPAEQVYDDVFLPALSQAKRDRDRGELTPEREAFLHEATREIIDSVVASSEPAGGGSTDVLRARVLGCPARDQEDLLALEMLRQVLDLNKWEVDIVPVDALAVELLDTVEKEKPALVCIGSVLPGGLNHTRYLCKRLRQRFPNLKILVGRWGMPICAEERHAQLLETGADAIATTLVETRQWLHNWLPVLAQDDGAAVSEEDRRAVGPVAAEASGAV